MKSSSTVPKWRFSLGARPAPDTPLAASTTRRAEASRRLTVPRPRYGQHPRLHQRCQGQDGRRRVATRGGDELGRAQLLPMQLRQAVDEVAQQLGGGVGLAVPGRVERGVLEAEVGGQVDDDADLGHQIGHQVLGLAMRQGHEHQVQAVQLRRVGRGVGEVGIGGSQGRGVVGHRLPRRGRRPWPPPLRAQDGRHRGAGAPPGVPGGTDDADLHDRSPAGRHRSSWPRTRSGAFHSASISTHCIIIQPRPGPRSGGRPRSSP